MLLTVRFKFRPKIHQEPCNKVGSLSPAMHLAGFETRTFRFYHNALNHSPLSLYQQSFKWLYVQITNNTCGLLWVQWALWEERYTFHICLAWTFQIQPPGMTFFLLEWPFQHRKNEKVERKVRSCFNVMNLVNIQIRCITWSELRT